MSNIGDTAPPIFGDASKFNGMNWITWRSNIQIVADFKSVTGYLDGSIPRPSLQPQQSPPAPPSIPSGSPSPVVLQTSLTSSTPIETPWDSLNPTPSEWKVCNAWTMGLLIYNTTDPLRLGININGTAAEAWKSYLDTYNTLFEVALANAEQELRNMTYIDGQDFTAFISQLHTKWTIATALGAKIDDLVFRMILLNSLPRSWDSIVTTLYTTKSSHDAINHLMSHWARVS